MLSITTLHTTHTHTHTHKHTRTPTPHPTAGAFGPAEDAMFRAATEWALEERLPVVYLAANSGARVGLAAEVKQCLRVEWANPADPTKGFRYLYLSPEDYASLMARAPEGTPVLRARRLVAECGEERYQLTGGWAVGRGGSRLGEERPCEWLRRRWLLLLLLLCCCKGISVQAPDCFSPPGPHLQTLWGWRMGWAWSA